MHPELAAVIDTTIRERARFEAFCRSLTSGELVAPIEGTHWRVKECLSHLATIDIWVGEWFAAWAADRAFAFRNPDGSPFNIDTWNEEQVMRLRDAGVDEILVEAARHREPLLATMATFSTPQLEREFDFRGNRITFLRYLQLWTMHDAAHSWDALKGLPRLREDPEVRAWMATLKLGPASEAAQGVEPVA
jgi:hypothetical protein